MHRNENASLQLWRIREFSTRSGWLVSNLSGRLVSRNGPIPIVKVDGFTPGPVWNGTENFAPIGIRSPDRLSPQRVAVPTTLSQEREREKEGGGEENLQQKFFTEFYNTIMWSSAIHLCTKINETDFGSVSTWDLDFGEAWFQSDRGNPSYRQTIFTIHISLSIYTQLHN
jgi:hypothetical protein